MISLFHLLENAFYPNKNISKIPFGLAGFWRYTLWRFGRDADFSRLPQNVVNGA
jgi:hypothetical protein